MQSPLSQIFMVLDTIPASLGIYLLSSILIVIGLVMTVYYWTQIPASVSKRLSLGLLIMLLVELVAFAVTMATNNYTQISAAWLPPLDRIQMAFIIIWLMWIWAFPVRSNWADYLVSFLSFGLLVAFGMTMSVWSVEYLQTNFNAHWLDLAWQLFNLGILVIMTLFIITRRPPQWGIGLLSCAIFILGHIIQILLPSLTGNYAGPVRLVTLVALPMILTLPQRFLLPASSTHKAELRWGEDKRDRRRYTTELRTALGFLNLAWEDNPRATLQQLIKSFGQALLADICLFVTQPDRNGQVTVLMGCDFHHRMDIDEITLSQAEIPLVVDALNQGRNLRLPETHTATTDTVSLCKLIKHDGPSAMLFHPVTIPNAWKVGGIVMLTPFSHRVWTPEDSIFVSGLVEALIHIIEHNQIQLDTHTRYQKMTDELRTSEQHIANLQEEMHKLSVQLEAARYQSTIKKTDTSKAGTPGSRQKQSRKRSQSIGY